MKKILSNWLYCLTFLSCSGIAASDETWLYDFAAKTQAQAQKHNIPGYIFVFVRKGETAKVVSFGSTEKRGEPIDSDTVFRLASVSKTFAGVLMAKMVEQTDLSWQTPLLEIAPEYGFNRLEPKPITLAHLMSQSSGYMPNSYDNLIEANYSVKRVLGQLAKLEPLCEPGKCYTYQNALFGVLEDYYLNQHSSYSDVLKSQIIQPLRMPNASTGKLNLQNSKKWAKPHVAISRRKWRETKVQDDYYRFTPAAGVNASIADMAIWIRAMLGEYPNVVPPSVVETVTTPQIKTTKELRRRDWRTFLKDAHYGMGWRIYDFDGHKLNYHGGWVKGYRADVSFAPDEEVGYAMLMNAESNLINGFTAQFWQQYFNNHNQQQLTAQKNIKKGAK
ncbi:serine hydrolase domain-containing protein [Aliiglaciecola sp. LCG003]|uniref:serine hydrolase domain-containing protein n=1 Tax=Aliiglaciecola sp. LCG003 TaxID=3053655 RepID=UPI002573F428|nr:serine hydrolase domain-containing protein [Aliiglaciecola sp. LCG003]WJG09226.1 serine hydrolase domain-containing protein [Aliiglaciecola sp. LCG003]